MVMTPLVSWLCCFTAGVHGVGVKLLWGGGAFEDAADPGGRGHHLQLRPWQRAPPHRDGPGRSGALAGAQNTEGIVNLCQHRVRWLQQGWKLQ